MALSEVELLWRRLERAQTEEFTIQEDEYDPNHFLLFNFNTGKMYELHREGKRMISCTCPDHIYREITCKHMIHIAITYGYEWG